MEIRISNLKTEFNNISLVRSKIINVFETLKNKSDKLKNLYSEFIKQSNSQLFVFGLDSFHFQSKLIDLEYDDMKRIFLFVNNRMYCEYFKLYKLICSYVIENVTDKKVLEIIKGNNFPVYKDLEPFKDYKFEITGDVHDNILVLLNSIASIINNRENELSIHRSKQLIGLNIDNFVNSFNYEIILMKEKVNLFLSYIEFFHKLHAKYLKRFSNKIQLMSNHVNSDIQFDENSENNVQNNSNDDYHDVADEHALIDQHNSENNLPKLNIEIDERDYKNDFFEDYESGINTPSNASYKSTESQFTSNKKIKMPKFIKNGFKKVSNMITGCNNSKAITDELVLEKLAINDFKASDESLSISLNDFNDNVSEIEIKVQETHDECNIVVEEEELLEPVEPVVIEEFFEEATNEKETQTVFLNAEEPVVVVEEPVIAEEEPIIVVEEPVIVEEEHVVVVEEPVVVVEESVIVVEEPIIVVEEPVVVVEEPVIVVEEPVIAEEEHVVVVEEPVIAEEEHVIAEEEHVIAEEEHVVVVEEPIIAEEPPVIAEEEHVVVVEEPVIVVEETIVNNDE